MNLRPIVIYIRLLASDWREARQAALLLISGPEPVLAEFNRIYLGLNTKNIQVFTSDTFVVQRCILTGKNP